MHRRAWLRLFLLLLVPLPGFLAAQPVVLELNEASLAQLESLQGIGPGLAEKILLARRTGPVLDWHDLRRRVSGIGTKLATRLSAQGLVVHGRALD